MGTGVGGDGGVGRTSEKVYILLLFPSEAPAEFHLLWLVANCGLVFTAFCDVARSVRYRGAAHCERRIVDDARRGKS